MSRTLPLIALLIPLGCRGEFDIDKYLVAEDSTDDEGEESETDGSSCVADLIEVGDGCLGQRQLLEGLSDPTDLAVAQFASPGRLDLLVAGPELSFFLGSAGGEIGLGAVPLAVGGRAVAVGRIDDDALADFAALQTDSTALRRAIGGGNFSDEGTLPVGGWDGVFVDLDGDGDDDLVVSGGEVLVLLIEAGVTESASLNVAGQGIAVGDINDDGDPDLAIADTAANTIHLFANDGAGGFSAQTQYPISMVYDLAFVDLDGDGRVELLAVDGNNGNLAVLAVQPNFTVQPRSVHELGRVPRRLALGDVDGDGRIDAVTANRMNGDLSILLGDGSSLSDEIRVPPFDEADEYEAVAIADLDGDGRGEILVTAPGTGRVRVLGFVD